MSIIPPLTENCPIPSTWATLSYPIPVRDTLSLSTSRASSASNPETLPFQIFQGKEVIHQAVDRRYDSAPALLRQMLHNLHPLPCQEVPMDIRAVKQQIPAGYKYTSGEKHR